MQIYNKILELFNNVIIFSALRYNNTRFLQQPTLLANKIDILQPSVKQRVTSLYVAKNDRLKTHYFLSYIIYEFYTIILYNIRT